MNENTSLSSAKALVLFKALCKRILFFSACSFIFISILDYIDYNLPVTSQKYKR